MRSRDSEATNLQIQASIQGGHGRPGDVGDAECNAGRRELELGGGQVVTGWMPSAPQPPLRTTAHRASTLGDGRRQLLLRQRGGGAALQGWATGGGRRQRDACELASLTISRGGVGGFGETEKEENDSPHRTSILSSVVGLFGLSSYCGLNYFGGGVTDGPNSRVVLGPPGPPPGYATALNYPLFFPII